MYIISIDDMRAQGFDASTYPDDRITEAIETAEEGIENICGQWFEPRILTDELFDGNGTRILTFDVPIISLTSISLRFWGSWQAYNTQGFAVYKDLKYPRIEVNPMAYTGLTPCEFPEGPQSVKITGSFGYTKNGAVPKEIKRAALELAPIYLGTIITHEPTERLKKLMMIEEETDDHRYKVAEAMMQGNFTGIAHIDRKLARYRARSKVSHA